MPDPFDPFLDDIELLLNGPFAFLERAREDALDKALERVLVEARLVEIVAAVWGLRFDALEKPEVVEALLFEFAQSEKEKKRLTNVWRDGANEGFRL